MSNTKTKLHHHECYDTLEELEAAAKESGYTKVVSKTDYNGFHFERPPGPCPDHGGAHIPWTQKYGVSRVGGFGQPLQWQVYGYA